MNSRSSRLLALGLACGATLAAQDGPPRVFMTIETATDRYVRHQPIDVRIRIGVERRFARENLIQLFRTPLDLPLQVDANWLRTLPGTTPLPRHPDDGPSIAVNGAVTPTVPAGDVIQGGREYAVVEIVRRVLPVRPGRLTIPGARLRFLFASRFEDDLLRGRVPLDRQEGRVTAAAREITIEPLPAAGRPAGFTGAVGTFTIGAAATPTAVDAGSTIRWTVELTGTGNFGSFEPPDPPNQPGLTVQGKIVSRSDERLTVVYNLVPADARVKAIPPIRFAYYATAPGAARGYTTIATRPIPLTVRGTTATTEPRGTPGVDDIHGLKAAGSAQSAAPATWLLWTGSLLPWLLVFGLRRTLGARRAFREPTRRRAREAAATFAESCAAHPDQTGDALVTYLADRLDCSPAAVITHELLDLLVARGVPEALATRADELVHTLHAGRYGGAVHDAGQDAAATALVAEIEAALRA